MISFNVRSLGLLVAFAVVLGMLTGCGADPDDSSGPEPAATDPEPAAVTPEPAEEPEAPERPTVAEAEAAVLAIAREEYATMPIESATVYAMGRDAEGTWWVQAWTTASPEFEGEQGEQWFVTWDGESWTLVDYGTGLGVEDFPAVLEWEQQL